MKCPTCQTELNEQTIEDRKRTTCPSCSYMHYEPRKVTGAYYEFVDDIADDVASKGCCEMMTVALRNVCFPKDGDLESWCKLHGFSFTLFHGKDAHGKQQQFVRFARQR